MYGNDSRMNPPVGEGDEVEVTIESVGEKGDGMAKVDGFVLFVPNTQQGQRVKVKVTRVLQKVGFAQVVGEASAAPAAATAATPEAFDPKEELDSEDFGDEAPAEEVAEEAAPEEEKVVEEAEAEEPVAEEESDEEAIEEIEEAADEAEETVEEVEAEAEEALEEEATTPEEASAADIPAETVADAADEPEEDEEKTE